MTSINRYSVMDNCVNCWGGSHVSVLVSTFYAMIHSAIQLQSVVSNLQIRHNQSKINSLLIGANMNILPIIQEKTFQIPFDWNWPESNYHYYSVTQKLCISNSCNSWCWWDVLEWNIKYHSSFVSCHGNVRNQNAAIKPSVIQKLMFHFELKEKQLS